MRFSFNPSVWFVCKLCRRTFPDTDKLMRHKLEYHLEECTKVKCIIFEERCLDQDWHPYLTNRTKNGDGNHLEQDAFFPAEENRDENSKHNSNKIRNSFHSQSSSEQTNSIKTLPRNLSRKNPYVLLERLTKKQLSCKTNNSNISSAAALKPNRNNEKNFTPSTVSTSSGNQITIKRSSFEFHNDDKPNQPTTVIEQFQNEKVTHREKNNESDFHIRPYPHGEIPVHSQTGSRTRLNSQLMFKPEPMNFSQLSVHEQVHENLAEEQEQDLNYSLPFHNNFIQDFNSASGQEFPEEFNATDQQAEEGEVKDELEDYASQISSAGGVGLKVEFILSDPFEVTELQPIQNPLEMQFQDNLPSFSLSSEDPRQNYIESFQDAELQTNNSSVESTLSSSSAKIKKFMCNICYASLVSRRGLRQHMRCHSSKAIYACPHCPSSFKYRHGLQRHLILHGRKTKFQCRFCSKSFPYKSCMQDHERTHTGDRPFKCHMPECSSAFCSKSVLKMHLREKHCEELGLQQFICPFCGQAFGLKCNMNYHIRASHSEDRPFKCPQEGCKGEFKFNKYLLAHMREQHKDAMDFPRKRFSI